VVWLLGEGDALTPPLPCLLVALLRLARSQTVCDTHPPTLLRSHTVCDTHPPPTPPVIPPFHEAIDNAVEQLAPDGFLAATDFFVSGKYDTPMRQMPWGRRFFWR
jgi:hypothetical protein